MNITNIDHLLALVKVDYPHIKFIDDEYFVWSPKTKTISYVQNINPPEHGVWALLHEIAHAQLEHKKYGTDFSLLKLETQAWSLAKQISIRYNVTIDEDHVQDCLDTYRDWLHKRAKCPTCGVVSLQRKDLIYQCFNCSTNWQVPRSPLCRVSRRIVKTPKTY